MKRGPLIDTLRSLGKGWDRLAGIPVSGGPGGKGKGSNSPSNTGLMSLLMSSLFLTRLLPVRFIPLIFRNDLVCIQVGTQKYDSHDMPVSMVVP